MSGFAQYNPNPINKRVGDCVIRAISKALDQDWERTYIELTIQGFLMGDMPSANHVWGAYLKNKGFVRDVIPNHYGDTYTAADFAHDHPHGTFVLGLDGHVVCVKGGTLFDSWDSSHEVPVFYWTRKDV